MTAHALVTVGTDEVWAPPKLIEFALYADLTVGNVEEVRWDISDVGWITRGAIQVRGEWCRLDLEPVRVHRGQSATFLPGAIKIEINLVPIDMSQRALGGMRELPPPGVPPQIEACAGRGRTVGGTHPTARSAA